MKSQIGDPAERRDHEGTDRRRHGDRSGSDGRGGPRYAFRAPVAVRPDDIASAIADAVARRIRPPLTERVHAIATPLCDLHFECYLGPEHYAERAAPNVAGAKYWAYPAATPDLSPSPDMAAPANVPSASDVPAAKPAALRTPRAAPRRRSVSVAG